MLALFRASIVALCLSIGLGPAFAGSMMTMGTGKPSAAATGCTDTNVVAWEAAVVTAGGTVSTAQDTRVCTLVGSLKTHSLFSIQDRIFLHASENSQQATIDIVNLGVATPHGTITFAANQGYTGDGSTGFLDSGYTSGTNFLQNSASISTYVLTNRTVGGGIEIGRYDPANTGNSSLIQPLNTASQVSYDINDPPFSQQPTNANALGFWTASRTGASALALYKNSSSTAFASATASSITLPVGFNFFIGALNNNGTAGVLSSDQIAISTIGGGMTNTQAAQLQTDLNAYMTSLGTNVY
jgi:hypothetical protein